MWEIFREIVGNFSSGSILLHVVVAPWGRSICDKNSTDYVNFGGYLDQSGVGCLALSHKKLLRPMNSRAIPWSSDEEDSRGSERPRTNDKQVSYRLRLHQTKRSGAQASRHPPRWRARLDTRSAGRWRRVDRWQRINPPFLIQGGERTGVGTRKERQGTWAAGSEAKATTRWTPRAG